jgi:hypothetical protein
MTNDHEKHDMEAKERILKDKEFYPNCVGHARWFYDPAFDFPLLLLA